VVRAYSGPIEGHVLFCKLDGVRMRVTEARAAIISRVMENERKQGQPILNR
jgi:hypothetical protein